jgi:hypothetical protein
MPKCLCVAEKPSIAKNVAQFLSNGRMHMVRRFWRFELTFRLEEVEEIRIQRGRLILMAGKSCLRVFEDTLPIKTFHPNIETGDRVHPNSCLRQEL